MNIEYINDTGSRHEWRCVHSDEKYLVIFHYLDETWSVQRIREDGEREILDRREAKQLLSLFPRDRALQLTTTDTTDGPLSTPLPEQASNLDIDSTAKVSEERRVDFGPSSRQDKDDDTDQDASRPSA